MGIHLDLGPPGEPGTQGIVPAPNGYAVFGVVSPGIIAYRCFRGSYRQTAEEPAIEVVLRPRKAGRVRNFMDAVSRATGLTGMALYVYIVVSEGARFVLPARNLVPVP